MHEEQFYDDFWMRRRPKYKEYLRVSARLKQLELVRLIKKFAFPHTEKILDVGCGDGSFANRLSKFGKVTAFDYASETISTNKQIYPHIDFFVANATNEIPENYINTFDLVTCVDVIEHLKVNLQTRLIQNLDRFLTADGVLILSTPDRNQALKYKTDSKLTNAEFLRLFERQPTANVLTKQKLEELLGKHFKLLESTSVKPVILNRALDLLWKIIFFPIQYYGVNQLTRYLGVSGLYVIYVCKKQIN